MVSLFAKPAVRVPRHLGHIQLSFPEEDGLKKVIMTKIEEKDESGTVIQTGLRFRVFTNAESLKGAINSAKSLTDGIVSFMTLMTGRGMDIPCEEIAYEITPSVHKRDFVQVFYDIGLKSVSRRQIDPDKLIDFIDKHNKLDPLSTEQVSRAIRWYRLGAMVTDIFDQFNCFWIGLEALNPILQRKLSIGDDTVSCPNCKHKWIATPTVSGIRVFFHRMLSEEKNMYRNIRELRISIMHSTRRLRDLRELASIYVPKTGEALFRAICYLLGFSNWKTMTHGAILREFPTRGEIECSLIGGDPSLLGPDGEDPHFELHHRITGLTIEDDGTLSYDGESSLTAHLNPRVKFSPREIRFYGDSETTGAITGKSVRTADGKETPI